jgi:hypothetical protein
MQTALKTDPASYLHRKNPWERHAMEQQLKSPPQVEANTLPQAILTDSSSSATNGFVAYGVEFSKQFVFFFSNVL